MEIGPKRLLIARIAPAIELPRIPVAMRQKAVVKPDENPSKTEPFSEFEVGIDCCFIDLKSGFGHQECNTNPIKYDAEIMCTSM